MKQCPQDPPTAPREPQRAFRAPKQIPKTHPKKRARTFDIYMPAQIRLRTARTTYNSMHMAEGDSGTKIMFAYALRKTRLRENLTPPLRSAVIVLTRKI